jgi:5-(carboxyamino)imidazole ribonucleotide synthase
MLCLAAHPLGLKPTILASSSADSAWGCAEGHIGHPENRSELARFSKNIDLISFESEFYSAAKLEKGLKQFKGRIFPNLNILGCLQDRFSQKQFLEEFNLETSPFMAVHTKEDLRNAWEYFEGGLVLKLRTHGYDGKGTFYARTPKELLKLESILSKYPQGFIAERMISFQRELALMVFRSQNGSLRFYPLVESVQVNSRCDLVIGPIQHPGLPLLQKKIARALQAVEYVGAIAFELFDCKNELLVNEIAPRVHNSGHYSQEALNVDQFQMHLLCGLGEELPKIKILNPAFGMINLIGSKATLPSWDAPIESSIHWYNKPENRLGRKMGHLNYSAKTKAQVIKTLTADRRKFNI